MTSDPWGPDTLTPAEVEAEITRLSTLLGDKTAEYEGHAVAAAEADAAYRVEHAKKVLTSEYKTVGERESEALVACERLLEDRKRKDAVAGACLESVRSLREQLAAARSLSASVRASLEGV